MISNEVKEEIRSKIDIVEFLENRGVALRVAGANFVGLCPFHAERTPSFNVRPANQRYRCFGCGEEGDIFNLVQQMEQLSFMGAVQYLADEAGIKVTNEEDDEQYRQLKRMQDMTKIAAEYFRENFMSLPDQHPAKQNLAKRNLLEFAKTDPSIGFAPNAGLMKLLYSHRFSKEEIVAAGLAKATEVQGNEDTNRIATISNGEVREKFRSRLMWTIYSIEGRPIGFSGRRVYDENEKVPKYLNSPATRLFNKSKALLGLNFARKAIVDERSVYVVEGQTDVMAMQAIGVSNVVASLGTAFGSFHADMLSRLAATSTKKKDQFKFYFAFDPDAAGVKAAKSVFSSIPEIQLNSYVISLAKEIEDPETGDKSMVFPDPCDYRLAYGDDDLRGALTHSMSMVEFILRQELKNHDVLNPEGRSAFIAAARPTLAVIRDPLAHDAYLRKISYWTGIAYAQLVELIKKPQQSVDQEFMQQQKRRDDTTIDEKIFAAFLQYPDHMFSIFSKRKLTVDLFSDRNRAAEIIQYLPEEDALAFHDLKIPEGKEEQLLNRLVDMFLSIKYMEAVENLNARFAAATSDDSSLVDETLLFEILQEQQSLKTKYQQA
jgi:DNA primase